jgi:quinol monooxygenase YgiN
VSIKAGEVQIALIVSLEIHIEKLDQFLTAIKENATRTFTDEEGCRYFDVTQNKDKPTHFMFYELYDNEEAIATHRTCAHFVEWRKAADVCVVKGSQVNTICHQIFHHA